MKQETWQEYVDRILSGMAHEEAATRAGVSMATLRRWAKGEGKRPPDAHSVVAFARGFGQPPIKALLAAGYLDPSDIKEGTIEVYQSRSELSDDELIGELAVRLAERPVCAKVNDIAAGLTLPEDES